MDLQGCAEDAPEPCCLPLCQFEIEIALGGRNHRRVDECEHRNHPSHDVEDAIVLNPERLEHHPGCVQGDGHSEEHPDIEHQGVLGYAFVV